MKQMIAINLSCSGHVDPVNGYIAEGTTVD
jgi:hypothetical protein